ncbi:MAG TPA: SAM-dependent chlorinase/fluorinase [Dehalococcoidia bacterium]
MRTTEPGERRPPVITFTTDFGTADPYVAAMKGVALSICPEARLVDVTHQVQPQQVLQGAFLLAAAWPHFPPGTVHVAVVDPGVGTERRAMALATEHGLFVGPDNGLLSSALPDAARPQGREPARVPLPAGVRGVALTNPAYHRHPVSATFHGRDIFTPAAAHLAAGVPLAELGEPVRDMLAFPPFRGRRRPDGVVEGRVIHVDRFGNCITAVRAEDLPSPGVTVEVRGRRVPGLFPTYAALPEGPGALIGSGGYLELAVRNGSARETLGAAVGDVVAVRPTG